MELFKYIIKFIYRIRWWMVIFPCIAGIIAWFLTRSLEKTYDVKTTIFTGIISGYNVDATDTRNATVHMSNLMNIITTERTLKIVSLKLLARCLVYGDAERNTSYISAIHYQQLVSGIPRELQALIDKQNEEKTYHNLVAFERPSINNFIYQLLNYTHPYFCYLSYLVFVVFSDRHKRSAELFLTEIKQYICLVFLFCCRHFYCISSVVKLDYSCIMSRCNIICSYFHRPL